MPRFALERDGPGVDDVSALSEAGDAAHDRRGALSSIARRLRGKHLHVRRRRVQIAAL
jgi:hypothetical protein